MTYQYFTTSSKVWKSHFHLDSFMFSTTVSSLAGFSTTSVSADEAGSSSGLGSAGPALQVTGREQSEASGKGPPLRSPLQLKLTMLRHKRPRGDEKQTSRRGEQEALPPSAAVTPAVTPATHPASSSSSWLLGRHPPCPARKCRAAAKTQKPALSYGVGARPAGGPDAAG